MQSSSARCVSSSLSRLAATLALAAAGLVPLAASAVPVTLPTGLSPGEPYGSSRSSVDGDAFTNPATFNPLTYTPYTSGTGGNYTLNGPVTVLDSGDNPLATPVNCGSEFLYGPQVVNDFTVENTSLVARIFTVSVTSADRRRAADVADAGLDRHHPHGRGPAQHGFGKTDGLAMLTSILATEHHGSAGAGPECVGRGSTQALATRVREPPARYRVRRVAQAVCRMPLAVRITPNHQPVSRAPRRVCCADSVGTSGANSLDWMPSDVFSCPASARRAPRPRF